MIFRSVKYVISGDGEHRVRVDWSHRGHHLFATTAEIRDTVRELLLLLKEEEKYFAQHSGKPRATPTGKSRSSQVVRSNGNAKPNPRQRG